MIEEELLKKLTPVIEERIRYKIVRDIVDALEAQLYPPEEMFREDFVKKVGEAEERVKEGKVKSFENAEELDVFLDTLNYTFDGQLLFTLFDCSFDFQDKCVDEDFPVWSEVSGYEVVG